MKKRKWIILAAAAVVVYVIIVILSTPSLFRRIEFQSGNPKELSVKHYDLGRNSSTSAVAGNSVSAHGTAPTGDYWDKQIDLYDVSDRNIVLSNKFGEMKLNAYGVDANEELLILKLDYTNTHKKEEWVPTSDSFSAFAFYYIDVFQNDTELYEGLWYYQNDWVTSEYGSVVSDITYSYKLRDMTSDVVIKLKGGMFSNYGLDGKTAGKCTLKLQ